MSHYVIYPLLLENVLCTDPDRISPVKLCDLDLASKPISNEVQSGRNLSGGGISMRTVQSEPDLASPVGSAEFMAPEVNIFSNYNFPKLTLLSSINTRFT